VATSPKHFPGFGGSTINSDFGVAKIDRTAQQLEADLKPFRAVIKANAATIMVSHGIYSALDPDLPASLSAPIVTELLRKELGYEGVAMTDSLNASGLRGAWKSTVPRACVEAVRAGIDLVLLTGSLETARLCRQRITRAVYSGEVSEERLNEAATRVVALKRSVGL
jgi:beta-N-acetylhexosaminidase